MFHEAEKPIGELVLKAIGEQVDVRGEFERRLGAFLNAYEPTLFSISAPPVMAKATAGRIGLNSFWAGPEFDVTDANDKTITLSFNVKAHCPSEVDVEFWIEGGTPEQRTSEPRFSEIGVDIETTLVVGRDFADTKALLDVTFKADIALSGGGDVPWLRAMTEA